MHLPHGAARPVAARGPLCADPSRSQAQGRRQVVAAVLCATAATPAALVLRYLGWHNWQRAAVAGYGGCHASLGAHRCCGMWSLPGLLHHCTGSGAPGFCSFLGGEGAAIAGASLCRIWSGGSMMLLAASFRHILGAVWEQPGWHIHSVAPTQQHAIEPQAWTQSCA